MRQLAGVCWLVVPVRFCDWAGGLDGVYFADTTTPSRLSRGPSTVASIPAGSRCGGSYETPFAESGVSHVR